MSYVILKQKLPVERRGNDRTYIAVVGLISSRSFDDEDVDVDRLSRLEDVADKAWYDDAPWWGLLDVAWPDDRTELLLLDDSCWAAPAELV